MAKFEVTVYNKEVREKVREGEHHGRFTDDWADFHYIEINADSEDQARTRAEARYPKSQGFVIDNIQKNPSLDFE
jgi:hypothetical protein